jgi:folate-dependent phosphoribosylglycinamide formyltransferase PurN
VHEVTAELDHGATLAQAVVPVLPGDTAETLAARVLTQEHLIFPQAVRAFFERAPEALRSVSHGTAYLLLPVMRPARC